MKALIVFIAEYYEKTLTDNQIVMYASDLAEFTVEEVRRAWDQYRKGQESDFFPRPNKLIAILKPPMDEKSEALEAVSRIWDAIARFGWPNGRDAKTYIGELGWKVVERFGGWTTVCDTADSDGGILRAQMRDLAMAMQTRAKAGLTDTLPSLPGVDLARVGYDRRVLDLVAKSLPGGDNPPHEHRSRDVSHDHSSGIPGVDRAPVNRESVDFKVRKSE